METKPRYPIPHELAESKFKVANSAAYNNTNGML